MGKVSRVSQAKLFYDGEAKMAEKMSKDYNEARQIHKSVENINSFFGLKVPTLPYEDEDAPPRK